MMAVSERPLLEAELLAIDEINKTGGVLGCQIEPVIMDGASNPETFAQKAQELLSSGVQFLFGCWTSASRKAVKSLVEDSDGLLWYPVQYEGLEESGHIVYTGSCPVQQIVPAVEWILAHHGSRIFLVGSDNVFPRTANNLIRSGVESRRGSIVGERYVPQNGMDFTSIIEEIKRQKPDAVFSTVFGESNLAFYRQYHAAGIDARSIPVMGACLSEAELQPIADVAAGHYACQNYFQSLNRPENQRFVANIKKRCGEAQSCSAPMATAYTQIYLWKRVVEAEGSFDVAQVRSHVAGCEFVGPTGPIVIQQNHHTSMTAYIGRATPDGQFEIIDTTLTIRPLPWLGVEDSKLLFKTAVKEAMAAFPNVQNALADLAADINERKRAEEVLRESEGRLRRITENMLDMIAQTDLQGICEYASPSFKTVLGYDPKYVLGKSLFELVHPNDLDNVLEIILKALAANSAATFDYRFKHADGHYVWLESVGNPLFDKTGQITGTVLTTRDISERKRIESALQERMKELNCLYGVAGSVERSGGNLDAVMGEVVSIIPPAYVYPDIACARIILGNQIFESAGFKESRWSQSADIKVLGNIAGTVEVYYREEKPPSFEGPFLKEERALIDTIAERLGRVIEHKRAQDALYESEERYRDLFENSTDLIQSVNNAGRFEYVNGKWMETLGYTREETKQLTLMDILRKDQVQHCNELFERVRNGETLGRVETVFVSKDGREIIVDGNVNGQFKNGQFVATRAIFRDITEKKKAENALKESEERYKAIFDGASDGFLAADVKTNKFVFANPKMCEMTGYSLKELLELSVPDMHPKKEVSSVIEEITKQLQGESDVAKEIPVLRKDQTVIYCDIRGKVIEIEGQRCMVGIFRDVTERRQVEGMKDQFVSMVSHELRTPLTSIRASLGLLASGVIGALPEKGQRMLDIAVTNTDRLVRLINDILDSERLASGKTPMEKKQCSTAQLVKQASDVMKPMAEKAGVSFSVESQDAALWVDPDRIVQALTNLISNAIKFSPKGGRIWVAAERKENQMLFRVQDEGGGIPPDKLGLLFERFQQLDSSDAREKGGSGLGLSISRSIVEQHNGKIWIESTVGKGSTFFFTIPLPLEEVPLQPEATTGAPTTRKVLIIEDDPDLANILAAMLQRHDIQPHIALTGGKGIALSKQIHPNLIVLDLILPDMDGSMVVEGLRKDNILRSVPLVVYTVKELDKQQRENLRLGETLFFTKSRIPPEQFEEKVVQFMERILDGGGRTSVN
jgi:urea ABC transporter urea binding protein